MPIYRYLCSTCGRDFEVQAKISEAAPAGAPDCSSQTCQLVKQLGPVAAIIPGKTSLSAAKGHLTQAAQLLEASQSRTKTPVPSADCSYHCDRPHRHQ